MKRAMNKVITTILFLVFSAPVFAMAPSVQALQPKLLWEKSFKDHIRDISMAKKSGDVLVNLGNEILLYDKGGNEVFHWGPRIDRISGSSDISADGNIIVYTTDLRATYKIERELSDWDERVHMSARNGKELWNKRYAGFVRISPDGSKLILNYGAQGQGYSILNSGGNIIWEGEGLSVDFSPEGDYVTVLENLGLPIQLRDANDGSILWKTSENHIGIASISNDAEYISTFPFYADETGKAKDGIIYNRTGAIIMSGYGIVSDEGGRAVIFLTNSTNVIDLSSHKTLMEIPVTVGSVPHFVAADCSFDGNVIAIIGQKAETQDNLFVVDLIANHIWSTNVGQIEPDFDDERTFLGLTYDGKYLLIVNWSDNLIKMYQLSE